MRVHTLTVRGRVATVDDPMLVQGTALEDEISLDLDAEWDGLSVTVAVAGSGVLVRPAVTDLACVVPWEALVRPGPVRVYVEGRGADGSLLAHATMASAMLCHPSGSPISGSRPTDPTVSDLEAARDAALAAAKRADEAAQNAGGGGKVQSVEPPLALSDSGVLTVDVEGVRGTQVTVTEGRPTTAGRRGDSAIGIDGTLWEFTDVPETR